ncbi:hypothetical protein SAMN05216436_102245 [bacterium A37T11]|nr:hypothetical protein SAMN05216436_102245 [bacterium A37T11]
MDNQVQYSLQAALENFAGLIDEKGPSPELSLLPIFDSDAPLMEKVGLMDTVFDDHAAYEELREVCFDLLLINFFLKDVKKLEEDYLESAEWEAIEEATLDRGTELLNVLLYIRECQEEDLEPELDDFLNEYLLVNEDEFQDEHRIYEAVIANRELADSDYKSIADAAAKVDKENELLELFYPLVSFFYEPHADDDHMAEFTENSQNKAFDAAVYGLLINFNHS